MRLVDSGADLDRAVARLRAAATLYLDTEFESSRAGHRLSLIQVGDGDSIFLLDALKLPTLEPLAELLGDPDTEWVVHAGVQDVELLKQALGVPTPQRVFDTQIVWSLLGPEYSVSLAYLVYRVLGVRTGKPHQADDWMRRPLPESQLRYAAQDVEHLPALKRELERAAERLDRLDWLHRVCREQLEPRAEPPSEDVGLESFRNAWQLDAQGQAALRFLVDWYNARGNAARARGLDPKTLFSIASRLPQNKNELARLKGVPSSWAEREGDELTRGLRRAADQADSAGHVPIDPAPYATFERMNLEAWLQGARAALCTELRLAPELAFPNRALGRLADALVAGADPTALAELMHGWRRDLLGAPLQRYSAATPPPISGGPG